MEGGEPGEEGRRGKEERSAEEGQGQGKTNLRAWVRFMPEPTLFVPGGSQAGEGEARTHTIVPGLTVYEAHEARTTRR